MKPSFPWLAAIFSSCIAFPGLTLADASDPGVSAAKALQQQVGGGDITRPASGAVDSFQLTASSSSSQASLNLGTSNPNGTNWSLLLSSPLSMGGSADGGSSATNTAIATLDGLANGFAAKLKFSEFQFLAIEDGNAATAAMVQTAMTKCLGTAVPILPAVQKACGDLAPGVLIGKYDPDDLPAYLKEHFPSWHGLTAYSYGVQAAVGHNSFTYYLPSNVKTSESDVPNSIGAYLAIIPSLFRTPTLIDLSVNYQRAYTPMPSKTQCRTNAGATNCVTGSIGAPAHADKLLLSIDGNSEIRVLTHLIGMSPQITYDTRSSQRGVEFPVYFVADTKGNLVGGISAAWTNTEHFSIGVFVGAPFAFFSN
jgi:hypothetical protein